MKRASVSSLMCALALLLAIPFFAKVPTASAEPAETDWSQLVPGVDYVEGEVVVDLVGKDASGYAVYEVLRSCGFPCLSELKLDMDGTRWLLSLPDDVSVPDAIDILTRSSSIAYAKPNMIDYSSGFQRLAGADRYDTCAAIAKAYGAHGGTVILATGENFPDALCASALAGKEDAPILITSSKSLSAATARTLADIQPDRIIVVGGTGVVPDSVLKAACGAAGITMDDTQRLCGADRYATCLAVYEQGNLEVGDTCIVATGGSFADALSISPYAYATQTPIFLADPMTLKLDDATAAAVSGKFSKVIIVGGTGVVSEEVVAQIGATNRTRLADYPDWGVPPNRYHTSLTVASWETGESEWMLTAEAVRPDRALDFSCIAIATGEDFPDALTGGVLCGKNNSALLLVSESYSNGTTGLWEVRPNAANICQGYIFGGAGVVSDRLKALYDAALG